MESRWSEMNQRQRKTNRRNVALLLWVLSPAALYSQGPAGAASIEARTPAEVAAVFKPDAAGWAAGDEGYGGPATGDWTYALGAETAWSNYRVECRIHLVKPASRRDGMELRAWLAFANHAHLGGYEAGLILRHQSPQKFYRLAVSSLWKEIVLWRPSGGIVQAVPFPFEVGKTYHVVAECRGPRTCVRVDGKPLIDWWDTADPVESGKVGLARKEGESYFTAVKVDTLAATVKGGNWGPRAMDDHQGVHRRLSFFGSGPGDALILASDEIPPTGGGLKGRISHLVIHRRALSAHEIGCLITSE